MWPKQNIFLIDYLIHYCHIDININKDAVYHFFRRKFIRVFGQPDEKTGRMPFQELSNHCDKIIKQTDYQGRELWFQEF